MPFAATLFDDCRLVPGARLGAALHRARSQSGLSLAALSRVAEGRFLPDQLVAVERGDVELDDDDVRLLTRIYGLSARAWAPASMLDLVLDRAATSEFTVPADVVRRDAPPASWTAVRFVALSVLLGADLTSGGFDLGVLAEALEISTPDTLRLLNDVLTEDAADVGAVVAAMERRVAVPEVGFLVGETAGGTLVLVGRAPTGGSADAATPTVAACGELGELLERTR